MGQIGQVFTKNWEDDEKKEDGRYIRKFALWGTLQARGENGRLSGEHTIFFLAGRHLSSRL